MKRSLLLILVCVLFSCTVKPVEIEYGKDACHFCKMTIVDKTHASEIVTKKGRAHKYDAIECMLQDLDTRDTTTIEFFLVADYANLGELINARDAIFLVSKAIKSPMGANLSAFSNSNDINVKGKQYNWKQINERFK